MAKRVQAIRRRTWGILAAVLTLLVAGTTQASHLLSDTDGHSTLEQIVGGKQSPKDGFSFLELKQGESDRKVLELDAELAKPGRHERRSSLAYFGQFSDFQLADEESPVRVEFLDPDPSKTAKSAHRPQEALVPHAVEMSIRQMNRFVESPVLQGDGTRASMAHAVLTGDLADNQQRNEVEWVRTLLEGGTLNPNSGSSNLAGYDPFCTAQARAGTLNQNDKYTGVQDYDDYVQSTHFYDPDEPAGSNYDDWPRWQGLMERAQDPFQAEGSKVPTYIAPGNHDLLVQGNDDANAAYEDLATGCVKPLTASPSGSPDAAYFQSLVADDPSKVMLVPPDPDRWFIDRPQYKAIFAAGNQPDDHGFAYVDKDELKASDGNAAYYAFNPKPGVRFISLDASSQGGSFVFGPGANSLSTTDRGNIDHPQFQWLERELKDAMEKDELVVVYSHQALDSMDFNLADEAVEPCGSEQDEHKVAGVGHDPNPGCDRDKRNSAPIHLGEAQRPGSGEPVRDLLLRYPNVIAYVGGHSHDNDVKAYKRTGGGGFWSVKTPAVADWPSVQRLIEVMDNRDGTLSIFGTLIDHSAQATAPGGCSGTPVVCPDVASFDVPTLASIGRTITYNDPQLGPGPDEGMPEDRNVELLMRDPRRGGAPGDGGPGADGPGADNPPAERGAPRSSCAPARPRVAGKSVGAARLGRKRATNRAAFGFRADTSARRTIDRYCIEGGGLTRVGYPSRRYAGMMRGRDARRTRGRAILALTTHRAYGVKGVRPSTSARTMRRRIRGERRFRVGKNTWYLARGRQARLVFKVRRGKVLELGLADAGLTDSRRKAKLFLTAFRR